MSAPAPAALAPSPVRSPFIIGPMADLALFVGSPLLAIVLGVGISGRAIAVDKVTVFGHTNTATDMFLGAFIFAHLFLVFFRSHGNAKIRAQYPVRFFVVPVVLFTAMYASLWIAVAMSVLATWWDVYHSGMQTFGLGRIYDSKLGNDATAGRWLDLGLNQLLYAGPILAGATLWDHLEDFDDFDKVGSEVLPAVPYYVIGYTHELTLAILLIGSVFVSAYLFGYFRLARQGYRVSWLKVALFVSTGLVSVVTWGFNSFGQAFFIMNFFHALQYFALVWWIERSSLTRLFGLSAFRYGAPIAFAAFLVIGASFGAWAELVPAGNHAAFCLITTVALLHFWYDGFVWSVRKREV